MKNKRLKISDRLSYTLIALFVIIFLGIGVYAAVTAGTTPDPGHNIASIGAPAGCAVGQYLKYNGQEWACSSISIPSGTVSNVEYVSDTQTFASSYQYGKAEAICSSGKKVLGGGCYAYGSSVSSLEYSRPKITTTGTSITSIDGTSWECLYSNVGSPNPSITVHAFAICANI